MLESRAAINAKAEKRPNNLLMTSSVSDAGNTILPYGSVVRDTMDTVTTITNPGFAGRANPGHREGRKVKLIRNARPLAVRHKPAGRVDFGRLS
jgi:hypothetical protein